MNITVDGTFQDLFGTFNSEVADARPEFFSSSVNLLIDITLGTLNNPGRFFCSLTFRLFYNLIGSTSGLTD
jgi:hypothetical protein